MNIAIVVGTFPTVSETFISNQIISLINKGYKVDILSFSKGDTKILHKNIIDYNLLNKVSYLSIIPDSKIKRFQLLIQWLINNFFSINWLLFFRAINVFKFGKQAMSLKLFFKSLWFLSHGYYDIVHVHFGQNAKPIVELKEKGFLKSSKLVVSFHGYDLQPNKIENYKNIYIQLFRQADILTVNTIYTKNILLSVNQRLKNIHILPVGLDTSFFERSKKQKNKNFTILFCGRLVPFKGVRLTLSILIELHKRGHKNIKLEIIGDGPLKAELIKEIKRLELVPYVILHGALKQEKVKEIMENSHAFLLPGIIEKETGRAENQGLVIQEAQAMELPVIVSDVGGMKYGLIPDKSGFVIRENDIDGFVNAIEKLITNKKIAMIMGNLGREFVVKKYNNQVLVQKLLKIFMN